MSWSPTAASAGGILLRPPFPLSPEEEVAIRPWELVLNVPSGTSFQELLDRDLAGPYQCYRWAVFRLLLRPRVTKAFRVSLELRPVGLPVEEREAFREPGEFDVGGEEGIFVPKDINLGVALFLA